MRELIMPMLIFTLEHQFVHVLSEGEAEEKVFYYQKQGIGIGSSASGAIANLTLLAGEYAMLERMRAGGLRIMLYKRYLPFSSLRWPTRRRAQPCATWSRLSTRARTAYGAPCANLAWAVSKASCSIIPTAVQS